MAIDNSTHCARCERAFYPRHFYDAEKTKPVDTGYAQFQDGTRICFECAALEDLKTMRETGRIMLYLIEEDSGVGLVNGKKYVNHYVTNWPGTLKIRVPHTKKGYHNIARTRIDIWFYLDGYQWHGVQYGEWTQVVHCKRTKTYEAGRHYVELPENEDNLAKRFTGGK